MPERPTVCVDFDGTLTESLDGFTGYTVRDRPTVGARALVIELQRRGFRVVVLSSRADCDAGVRGIQRWLHDEGFPAGLHVTNVKVPAVAYISKWAVEFRGDFETLIGPPKSDREQALREKRRGPVPDLTEGEWGYVGALIDGEGCISGAVNTKGGKSLRVNVTNQHGEVMRWLQEKLGGSVYTKEPSESNGYRFPVHAWTLHGSRMAPLLEGLLERGLIRMKKAQAELAVDFFANCRFDGRPAGDLIRKEQERRILGIQQLNQVGHVEFEPLLVDDRAVEYRGRFDQRLLGEVDRLARQRHGGNGVPPAPRGAS